MAEKHRGYIKINGYPYYVLMSYSERSEVVTVKVPGITAKQFEANFTDALEPMDGEE